MMAEIQVTGYRLQVTKLGHGLHGWTRILVTGDCRLPSAAVLHLRRQRHSSIHIHLIPDEITPIAVWLIASFIKFFVHDLVVSLYDLVAYKTHVFVRGRDLFGFKVPFTIWSDKVHDARRHFLIDFGSGINEELVEYDLAPVVSA